jgi:hypothetical protein
MESVRIVRKAMDDFTVLSGLVINLEKSLVFLSGVDDELGTSLQDHLSFKLGSLLSRYPGVPLIFTRLTHFDCKPLVKRILSRIKL